jgi:hypothetical protein
VNLIQIYQLRHTITKYNGQSFNFAHGFASIVDVTNTTYYALDFYNQKIVMFDEYWQYKNDLKITNFAHAITIVKEIYISGEGKIQKRDQNLNLIKEFYNSGVQSYRGIYYNKTNDLIYVGTVGKQRIDVFNRDLTLVGIISTPGYGPFSIAEYDNKMFVASTEGSILVIENGVIIRSFTTVCGFITSIMIDTYGNMLVLSVANSLVFLYHANGSNLGTPISTSRSPLFINFDSNGRFIITSQYDIKIYY